MQNGNQSANSAYQTWRQYSGNPLKKKEISKANLVDIESKFITPSQQDWVGEIYKTGKALLKVKSQMEDDADAQAQRIFGSRSLEQFTKEYQEGNLPSQNNPLVMSRMKYMYGQTVAGLAHTDFLNRVASNEFHDKTPEEVDKIYYDSMNQTFNEYRELFDFTKGDDKYYNNGFWEGGYKGRALVSQAQQETKDKFTRQLASTGELSNIAGIASTSENIYDGVDALNTGISMGTLATPQDMIKGVETLATSLALSPRAFDKEGNFVLDKIKDLKVHTLNKTIGQVHGVKMTTLKLQALDYDAKNNFDQISRLTGTLERLVAIADVPTLESMLAEELSVSNNFKTPRANLIENARNRAIKKQEAENAKLAGSLEKKQNMEKALYILANPETGKISPNTVTGINKEAWDNAFNTLLNTFENPSDQLNWALSVAERASDVPSNPAKTWLNSFFKETFESIERDVSNFNHDPTTIPNTWSERAQVLFKAYSMNPNVLDAMVADDYHGNSTMLKVLSHLYASGMDYRDVLKGMSHYKSLKSEEQQNLNLQVAKEVKNLQLDDETYGRSDDPYSFSVIRANALVYAKVNPEASPSQVLDNAVEIFKKENVNFKGAYIPKSFFNVLGADTDPNIVQDFGMEALETLIKKDKKIPKDKEILYMYVPHLNSVAVIGNNMNAITAITHKDLRNYFEANREAYEDKVRKRQEALLKEASTNKTIRSVYEEATAEIGDNYDY